MLQWSEEFTIGNERIDFEHHIFLGLVRDFQAARLAQASQDRLARMLQEIALYAKFHFRSEENLMEDMGYPGLEDHRAMHYRLIEVLSNKMMTLELGQHSALEVEQFLIDWFVEHVTREDSQIARFAERAQGGGRPA